MRSILEFRWSIKREKERPITTVQPVELSLHEGSGSRSRALTMTETVAAKTSQTLESLRDSREHIGSNITKIADARILIAIEEINYE